VAVGPDEAATLLGDPAGASILLLDDPLGGLDPTATRGLIAACRARADAGAAVVLNADTPAHVALAVSTLALLVAGRLVSFGAPAVALALQILSAGGHAFASSSTPRSAQAGSIITSST
jgi:ABC-type multidrug transport system ATPase subunit